LLGEVERVGSGGGGGWDKSGGRRRGGIGGDGGARVEGDELSQGRTTRTSASGRALSAENASYTITHCRTKTACGTKGRREAA